MRLLPLGEGALLVEPAAPEAPDDDALLAVLALQAALEAEPPAELLELVPAARTLLVRCPPARLQAVAEVIRALRTDAASLPEGELVELPVHYDGEDLDAVVELLGLSREALITRHAAPEYRVAFVGFAPGFGYLSGGDPGLHVPRRADPRPRIPAGSVAMAGAYSGLYPRASPGGWQLLGRTDAVLWDERREPPALLRPGARVRFAPTRAVARIAEPPPAPLRPAADRGLEVLHPGGRSLLQDAGRPGLAALGVAPAGALDRAAVRRANRLVGAPAGAAVVEHVLGGLRLRARGRMLVAVAGADADVLVDGAPVDRDRALLLENGAELELGPPRRGAVLVLAAQGGIAPPPVLGSRSRDTLAGLGPPSLAAGDVLPLGSSSGAASSLAEPGPPLPAPGDEVALQLLPGPRQDWFPPEEVARLHAEPWTVSPRSDRIALRLDRPHPLRRLRQGELASEGLVRGAVQVPPDGRPVLFLADHPLTGGYPVIGVVAERSLDLAAQCPPGAIIRFTQGRARG